MRSSTRICSFLRHPRAQCPPGSLLRRRHSPRFLPCRRHYHRTSRWLLQAILRSRSLLSPRLSKQGIRPHSSTLTPRTTTTHSTHPVRSSLQAGKQIASGNT